MSGHSSDIDGGESGASAHLSGRWPCVINRITELTLDEASVDPLVDLAAEASSAPTEGTAENGMRAHLVSQGFTLLPFRGVAFFYKLKARPCTSETVTTRFIAVLWK